jgi:DNA end-binding protein Ku
MLDLAIHIVETKKGTFEPEKFEDQYEDALKELIRKKQKGEKIDRPGERAPSNIVNLMDALRQSVKADRSGAPQKAIRSQAKKGKNRIEGQREMLLPISGRKGKEAAKPVARAATRRKAG